MASIVSRNSSASASTGVTSWNMTPLLGKSGTTRSFALSRSASEGVGDAVPVISDRWPGIDDIFVPGQEILVADSADDVLLFMSSLGRDEAAAIGRRARERVLAEHTAERRVAQLEALAAATAGAM